MDQGWPYSQSFSHLTSGSPHLPPSAPTDENANNFGNNPAVLSCPGSNFESRSTIHQSPKRTDFFGEAVFNGACKEGQPRISNVFQGPVKQNSSVVFSMADSTTGYAGAHHSSFQTDMDRPSPGPFGVLPHETVMNRSARFDRNADKFVPNAVAVSYNNGPYTDSAYSSAASGFGDNASQPSSQVSAGYSPPSNFSSPGEASTSTYTSPQNNIGAYSSRSPSVPPSPNMTQNSYSPSLSTTDHSAPSCSPISGASYVNNLNVPQRNGKLQHSPNNSAASNICYNGVHSQTVQSQNMIHHIPPSLMSKAPDYHSEYRPFSRDHNSQSYSSLYSNNFSSKIPGGNNSRISPRNTQPIHHDGHMPYNQMPTPSNSSPTYMQNRVNPQSYCSSSIAGQSVHSQNYTHSNINAFQNNPPYMPNSCDRIANDRQYAFPATDMVDDQNALDMFNSHVDSGIHSNSTSSTITNFLETDLPMLEPPVVTNRQLRPLEASESRQNYTVNTENSHSMTVCPPASNELPRENMRQTTTNCLYNGSNSLDNNRPGNLTFNMPRRRGRRGRRRKNDDEDSTYSRAYKSARAPYKGYSVQPVRNVPQHNNAELRSYSEQLSSINSRSERQSERNVSENNNQARVLLPKLPLRYLTIEEELSFLGELEFPEEETQDSPQTFMRTRNRDLDGFLQSYKNFLATRKSSPDSEIESLPDTCNKEVCDFAGKEKKSDKYPPIPKLRLKRCGVNKFLLVSSELKSDVSLDGDRSASSSEDYVSSHIRKEKKHYSRSKRKYLKITGKLYKLSKKLSEFNAMNGRRDTLDHNDKYNDFKANNSHYTNSHTLPAGKVKIKKEIDSSQPCDDQLPSVPKKRGRKPKNPLAEKTDVKKNVRKTTDKSPDHTYQPVTIKQEISNDVFSENSRRLSLRARKMDISVKEELGTFIKKEPIDLSSDDEPMILDDSDSDPVWTPKLKSTKTSELQSPFKRRGHRVGRKPRSSHAKKQKRGNTGDSLRKKNEKSVSPVVCKKEKICETKVKKEKNSEKFLVAKADINKERPFIWRVDKETSMLQRFESYEHQGILLYRSTYTYAAWNEISFSSYVKANVKIVSRSRVLYIVEYLGPALTEAAENLSTETQVPNTNPLRENFEIFLQTLISQVLDPNFLSEITNENDEYFLSNIKEIERITDVKKKALMKDLWDEQVKKCADTYPCVNILDTTPNNRDCEICNKDKGTKLLQFYGQPYDKTTLGSVEIPFAIKAQFIVCVACSAVLSLYNKLHHQKYNFFVKCRTKMNEAKENNGKKESHVLLEVCLQDHTWVNNLFEELRHMWQECGDKS